MSQTSSPSAGAPTAPDAADDADLDTPARGVRTGPTRSAPAYGLAARLGDWMQARADGRAGLPSLRPGRPAGTPALEALAQDFLARCHRERLRVDEQIAPLLEARASLAARIPETERAAEAAEAALAAWPQLPDSSQLSKRRAGERETAEDVVVARRSREWEAHRRPLLDQAETLRGRMVTMRGELARVGAAIQAREVAGATRVRRLHAQAMRRISSYERHLVRHHPAGDRVGPALAAQHPRVPGWVRRAEDPDQHLDPAPREAPEAHRATPSPAHASPWSPTAGTPEDRSEESS